MDIYDESAGGWSCKTNCYLQHDLRGVLYFIASTGKMYISQIALHSYANGKWYHDMATSGKSFSQHRELERNSRIYKYILILNNWFPPEET